VNLPKIISHKQLEISLNRLYDLHFLEPSDDLVSYLHSKIESEGLERGEFFSSLINFVRSKRNITGKILVEGTPRHAIFYKEIIEDFPDAKFIIMERDGLDTAISAKTTYGYPFFQGLEDASALKKACNQFYDNNSDRVIAVVNYDVLQREPETIVNNIYDKLGVENIPKDELVAGAKSVYEEMHSWYYLNEHQPKMRGIMNKKVYPSLLNSFIDNSIFRTRSILRDGIINFFRKTNLTGK